MRLHSLAVRRIIVVLRKERARMSTRGRLAQREISNADDKVLRDGHLGGRRGTDAISRVNVSFLANQNDKG